MQAVLKRHIVATITLAQYQETLGIANTTMYTVLMTANKWLVVM